MLEESSSDGGFTIEMQADPVGIDVGVEDPFITLDTGYIEPETPALLPELGGGECSAANPNCVSCTLDGFRMDCAELSQRMETGSVAFEYLIHDGRGFRTETLPIISFGAGLFGTDRPYLRPHDSEGGNDIVWRPEVFSFGGGQRINRTPPTIRPFTGPLPLLTPPQAEPQQPQQNDCTNMADDAQRIADAAIRGANAWRGRSPAAILQRFNRNFTTRYTGSYAGEGTAGTLDMPFSGPRAAHGQRGFAEQFRATPGGNRSGDGDDQTHHFAAHFSTGMAGHNLSSYLYGVWDRRRHGDEGDVRLGAQSHALGLYLRNNPRQLSNVGQLIRNSICNGNPVPR